MKINLNFLIQEVFKTMVFGFILFFVAYISLNLFISINIYYLFLIAILLSIINTISSGYEKEKTRKITRYLSEFSQILLWFSLMYLILSIAIYLLNLIVKIPINYLIIIYSLIIPIITIYGYIKGHKIKIKEYDLFIKNLKEEINIIHFSDVHIGSIRGEKLLKDIVSKINSTDAEIAILSGDLADGSTPIEVDDFSPLKDSKIPIIFTPGNHDYYPGLENVIKAAENANLKVLFNDKIEFKGLSIHGFFVSSILKPGVSIENSNDFSMINSDDVNIVINHFPVFWDEFKNMGVDIQLSGHTHGGQFYPIRFLIRIMFKYVRGIFKEDNKYLVVSDGVGTYQAPIRWGTDSEIILLRLKKILE